MTDTMTRRAVQTRYAITAETWYADTAKQTWEPDVVAELRLGIDWFTPEGYPDGMAAEWYMRWHAPDAEGATLVDIVVLPDAQPLFDESGFEIVLDRIASGKIPDSIEAVAAWLSKLGWVDGTERVRSSDYMVFAEPVRMDGTR